MAQIEKSGMKWMRLRPGAKPPCGPVLYYYPPITGSEHPSNDKPECFALELFSRRWPTWYARITNPGECE